MEAAPAPVSLDALLAHREWVRRVALALVRDEQLASDLEQDLWVKVLEHPPRVRGSIRGWLAATLRNAFLNRRRGDLRRTAREKGASRTEAVASSADLVADGEALRRVVNGVMDLAEPYRTTVLHRYYEDLLPGEIAARQEIPVETVRTRLKRAVAMLREKFDTESGGDRAAWCSALLPLTGRADALTPTGAGAGVTATSASGLALGGVLMAKKALAAVVVTIFLLGAGWLALRPGTPVPNPVSVASVPLAHAPAPVPGPPAPTASPSPPAIAKEEEIPPPVDLAHCDRDLDLFGEVVNAEGKGVPGARISTISHPRRRARVGSGEEFWSALRTPRTRSSTDGTFALRLQRGEVTDLEVAQEGFGASVLPACQAGERVKVVLEKATSLEVVVRDLSGKPVEGARLRFYGMGPILTLQATTVVRDGTTGPDGRFVVDGLTRETLTVAAAHPMHGLATGLRDAVEAGASTTLEIAFAEGRSIEGKVTDSETGKPIPGASVGTTMLLPFVALTDLDGGFLLSGWSERLGSKIRAEALGYGTVTALLPAGGPVDIALEKGDRVIGRFVGGDGVPVPEALVGAAGERREGQRSESDQRSGTCGPDGRFAVESLRHDMPHALVVLAPGHARTLLDFPPHEGGAGTIDLGDIVLPAGNSVEGTVVDGDGTPLAGVLVEVRGANLDRSRLLPAGMEPGQGSSGISEGRRTDDLGRFRFPDQPAGTLSVTATVQGSPRVTREVEVVHGKPSEPVELRLGSPDRPGRSIGKESLVVLVASEDGSPVEGANVFSDSRGTQAVGTTKADGTARLEHLLAGDVQVSVQDSRREPRFLAIRQTLSLPHEGELRIVVRTASSVSGMVLGPAEKPLPGLLVQLIRASDGTSLGGKMSDDFGKFNLAAPLGEEVTVDASSWPPGKGDEMKGRLAGVRAPAAGLVLRVRRAERNRTVTVVLTDVAGGAVEGATVYCTLAVGGRPGAGQTDAAGRARFEGLKDDEYRIEIGPSAPGPQRNRAFDESVPPPARRVVPSGQEEAFRFRSGIEIRGVVKLPDGTPATGGTVLFTASDGVTNRLVVNAEGRFRVVVAAGVKLIEFAVESKGADGKGLRASRKDWTPAESCDIVLALEPIEGR